MASDDDDDDDEVNQKKTMKRVICGSINNDKLKNTNDNTRTTMTNDYGHPCKRKQIIWTSRKPFSGAGKHLTTRPHPA